MADSSPLFWFARAVRKGGVSVLALSLPLLGQGSPHPKISDGVAWSPQGWVLLPFKPGARPVIKDMSRVLHALSPAPGLTASNQWTVRNGALYEIGVTATGDQVDLFRLDLGAKPGTWERLGRFASLQHGLPPIYIYPLDTPGLFLGLSWMGGFTDRGQASFAALFRSTGDDMVFDRLVEMPFGDRSSIGTLVALGADPSKGGQCAAIHPALEPTLAASIATDRYAYLVATQAGVLWAFDLKDGHCAKVINVGGLDWRSLASASLVDHFILAAEPEQDGDLIIATRDPEVLTVAQVFEPNALNGKESTARSRSDFTDASRPFGGIHWWVVDGKSLELHPASGDRFPVVKGLDYQRAGRFRFLIDADGQIRTSLDGRWNEFLQQLAEAPGSAPLGTTQKPVHGPNDAPLAPGLPSPKPTSAR